MAFFCTLSLVTLGQALAAWLTAQTPSTGIIAWLSAGIGFLGCAIWVKPSPRDEFQIRKTSPMLVAGALGLFAADQMLAGSSASRSDMVLWLVISGLMVLYTFRHEVPSVRDFRKQVLPIMMLGFLLVSVRTIRENPNPKIDVFFLEQAAGRALLHFENPYTATIPDVYGPSSPYHIPYTKNGYTVYGFPYPPLAAFINLPAIVLAGDYRYTQIFALLLSSVLIAFMRDSWASISAAVLLLVNPLTQTMIQWGWEESVVILSFCLTVFCISRYPRAIPYLFGVFLSTKQTNLALLPLAWILIDGLQTPRRIAGFLAKSIAVLIAIYLPFFLWNPDAFVASLILMQTKVAMRTDLISYAAYAARRGWFVLPMWVPFLYLPIGLYIGLKKAPRTAAGFAAASAIVMIPFFALSKQGAPNYYFFGMGILCCILAFAASGDLPADTAGADA